jgi:hypothetical protein
MELARTHNVSHLAQSSIALRSNMPCGTLSGVAANAGQRRWIQGIKDPLLAQELSGHGSISPFLCALPAQ